MSKQHRTHGRRRSSSTRDHNHHRHHTNKNISVLSSDDECENSRPKMSQPNGRLQPLNVHTGQLPPNGARSKDLVTGQDYRGMSPGVMTPSGSQSRRCVSRKDLREISPDKLNKTTQVL